MDKRIYEPGYLHCFLNGPITLPLSEEVTRVNFEQIGFGSVSCCDRWTMKCLSRTEPAEEPSEMLLMS